MRPDTTFIIARIIGPVLVLAGIALITQPARMLTAMGGFLLNDAIMAMAAFVTLILGLTVVTLHQRWDTVTAILISLVGWILVARGAVMLIAPDLIHRVANFVAAQPKMLPIAGCAAALLGVWFSYAGYIAGTLRADFR